MTRCSLLVAAVSGLMLAWGAGAGRVAAQPCTADPATDWRTTIETSDTFMRHGTSVDEPRWVKFTIMLCDPGTVYFQNSWTRTFHYDFASARLRPFQGMSRAQFDAVTLHASGQQAVLGAVLAPGFGSFFESIGINEIAIQLVRQDAYPREQVRDWFNLVKSRISNPGNLPVLYFPTFEQQPSAQAERQWLSAQGIEVSGPERWIRQNACYAQGWAVGTLRFVPGAQVGAAYRAGTLRPADILLTDGVPSEVPPVAGIVSLAPATPNSHVALLSQTWGIPFVYLADTDGDRAEQLVGLPVIVRSYARQGICRADITDASRLPPGVVSELLAMKAIEPLDYDPVVLRGAYLSGVDGLGPADTARVGGKAANYGVLRRAIPAHVRPGAAVGFDLWAEYLAQPMLGGLTLRQTIDNRLAAFTAWPPADPAALATALGEVRNLFTSTSTTRFTPAQESALLAGLRSAAYGFNPDVKLRFRSSTNVEDTAVFTGAGLYDSFSGCLRDDIDGDAVGPSACDPAENSERGVLRAIRRVFASFYNDNAYQARRRLGVIESEVGMAMLVHHSFPDPTELANGVAVFTFSPGPFTSHEIDIVTQAGATSVTNPEDGSTPEQVRVFTSGSHIYPELVRSSSRVILGQTVMTYPSDYELLTTLMTTVANRFVSEQIVPAGQRFALDFEFKKTTAAGVAGGIEIKQVRRLPLPSNAPTVTPMLISRPVRWCLFQGETADVFSNHRAKIDWLISTDSVRLTDGALASGFLADLTGRLIAPDAGIGGCRIGTIAGRPGTFPGSAWSYDAPARTVSQRWRIDGVPNPRTHTLTIEAVPSAVSAAESPVVYLDDFGFGNRHLISLRTDFDQPVPIVDWQGQIVQTTMQTVALCPCPQASTLRVDREIVDPADGVTIATSFNWVPGGAAAGYTFDLASWNQTTITGLTPRPIVLRSSWSQTYRPGHHNFTESFIFDPRLEPGISPAVLQALSQRSIAYLLVPDFGGLDGDVRLMSDACLPCPADWDASGALGVQDIFVFLAAWFGGDPRADWDGDHAVAVQDLFEFLGAFFSGCP